MGKVNNDPIFLPEKEYNEKLNSEIGKLIDNGFNDEDIKLYGEDFKKRYQIKKKEDSSEVSVSDSTPNVTRSVSASNQTVPDKFAVAEDINKALLDAGYTQEQINLQQKSMNEANLGQIQEEFKFEKEENTLADRSGLPNFEGEVKTENVRVLASELDAPVSFNLEEQQKQLGNFKKLLDKGEITQDEYNDVENTITKPTKRKLARFEELKKTYNPERMEELTVKFKEAGVLSNDEISGIDREIDRKRKGDYTFLEKAKLALGFTTERKIKNININDRNAIVQQKIKNKQAEFLSGLDNDEKLLFESYLVKRNEKLQEEVKQAENFNDSIVKIAIPNEIADIKVLDEQIKSIVDKDRNSLTEEDLSNYKTLIDQRKNKEAIVNSLGEQYEVNRKTMLDNSDDLMSFDDEIDLAKRDFSFYSNRIKAIDRGFQYLTENALAFTGNTLTTIASQSGRVRDFVGDERLKNAQDIFNAWQINIAETKEKFEESIAPKKSLSDVNSISDFGSYVGDLITEQIPILATIYATGGTGLTGVTLASGGDRTGQLLKQVEAGEKEYTQEEIIGNGLLYSAGEFIGERITLGILNDYKRVFNTINKSGATKTTFKEALKKQVNGALKGVRTANQEGLSEVYTEFVQLLADDLQLNENRSGNFFEAYVGGFVMGKGIHVTGSIPNMALGAYSNSKNKRKVEANTLKVRELEQIISEGDLTDAVKSSYQQQIIDLLNDNQNTIFESADALQYLDSDQLKEITSINNQIIEVQKSLQGQTNENVSNALKVTLKQLTDRKDQILSTPQETLENLPDKGQALKEEAAKVLTEEKQNSGAKEFEITDTDITFKAAQLFQESQKNPLNLNVEETKSTASKEVKDFVEGLGVVKDTSQFIEGAMKFIQDGVSVNVGKADNGNLVLETIYVPRSERGQGKASKVLDSIIERADEQGKTMELTVTPLDDNITFSGLINLYERKGFVKEEGFVEDGGKMIREPKSEGFESIDLVLSQTTETTEAPNIQEQKSFTPETTVETNSNTYNVSLENGNLNISPTIGNPEISRGERNKIINQYIEQTDFSQGETANFEGKGDLTDVQVSEVIANESNNPLEIAREIVRVQENSSQRINELKDTKSEAIANVLRAYPLNTESRREVTDLGRFYTSRANKTNEPISIDQAREIAESELGSEVDFQDVLNFLNDFPSITDYNNSLTETIPETTALQERFKNLTGIEATPSNIEKVISKETVTESDVADTQTDEVPFQVESKQTKISGSELAGLVNRLKKTGLADDVKILSDSQIKSQINSIKDSENIQNQFPNLSLNKIIGFIDRSITKYQNNKNVNDILEKAKKEGNYLLAPNGKKSNLPPYQWGLVRTENFKNWFGDWQNNPSESSKVVDENGEPRIMYHGTNSYFNEFKASEAKIRTTATDAQKSEGFFFTNDREGAYDWTNFRFDPVRKEKGLKDLRRVLPVFLNIRNAYIEDISKLSYKNQGRYVFTEKWFRESYGLDFNENMGYSSELYEQIFENSKKENADGVLLNNTIDVSVRDEETNDAVVYNPSDIKLAFDNTGEFNPNNNDIRYQLENSQSNIIDTPNGFVYNNVVYLNRQKVKADTPIHEFGHLWNSYIKENNPDVYKRGLDLIKNSQYHKDVKESPFYSQLNEEQQLEEALAQAIGEKGVKIINESRKAKFATWFRNLFSRIAQGLGLRNLKGDQLADLTLEKFTDLAAGELLSGIEIREGRSPEVQKNQVADVTQIDVVVAERQATIKERERLKKIALSKKSVASDVKKQIIKYINEQTNKKTLSKTQKSDVTRLLNVIKNAKTKTNLLRAFETVNEVFTKIENRLLLQGINDILDRKLSKRESGRRKANLVTEEVEQILNSVKKNIRNIEKEVSVPLKRSTRNRINETLSNLFDQRQELVLKENKTNTDYIELEGLVISIDILSGLASQNANTTNKNFTEALGSLDSLYNFGRSELKLLREERAKQDEELLKDVIDDVNPEGITTIKTDREIQADRKKITNSIQRLLFQAGSGWFSGNLDSIMTVISRRTGANRDSSPLVRLVNEMKSKETGKKRRISIFSNKVVQAQKDIFGSIKKSDIALNSRAKINVNRIPPGADLNTPKLQEELNFSNSQLLNLWMNNKNPKLKEGLEANGFDSKFFEQVEKILPSKVKEYGEALFNVYEELHIEADNVYKQMNFHSMGKEDFYAGKVYRTDVEVKPEDLKINAGNYSINTTGFGSQKERTANDKPIEAMDVNTLVIRAIGETSHYVAFADVHRRYSKIIKDKGFVNAVNSTNKTNGDLILNMLNFYKERDLEKGGYRGNAILDALGRNISRSTLALKAKIGVTQTVSFFNGGIDMPKVSGLEFVKYYNPVELVKTMRELLNESDYLKNRYDVEGIENAMTGLSSIADKSEFSLNNNTLEANRKAASRFMKRAFEFALSNVKYGDMAGVAGAVPAYRAWLDTYKKQGLSDEQAKIKAIAKFESSVDRSQQTTSTFGKSPFQKHPIGRYFAMFATAPIQNLQNANYHWRELYRNLKKEGSGKGDNFRHIMGIMNYQFAQPMLYTYIANLMAGSLATALGFGDEEPDDLDKSLLSSAILSNYSSVPIFGSIATGVVDNIIGKEFSYGGLVSSAFFSTTDRLSDDIDKWIKARSKKESVKYRDRALKQLSGLLIGLPSMVSDTFIDWDSIYWNDDVDESVKLLKAMGYSNFLIEKSLTPRVTREEAKKKKRILEKKYKKSINKYDKQSKKTNPLFSKKNKKKR